MPYIVGAVDFVEDKDRRAAAIGDENAAARIHDSGLRSHELRDALFAVVASIETPQLGLDGSLRK